jgi:hypothetical protein
MGLFDKLSRTFSERAIRTGVKLYRQDHPSAPFMEAIEAALTQKEGWTAGNWRLAEPQIRLVYEMKGEQATLRVASWLDEQAMNNYIERKRLYQSMGISIAAGEAQFHAEQELMRHDGREAALIRLSLETLPLDRL